MRLPAQLSRRRKDVHKKTFGHVLIIAGSGKTLGAGALASLSALRSGAGLVTWAVPKSLNAAAQKKVSNEVMTLPLKDTQRQILDVSSFKTLASFIDQCDAVVLGPGLSTETGTRKLVEKIIQTCPVPLVLDADALNAIAGHADVLNKARSPVVITPHPGEFQRLTGLTKSTIQKQKLKIAKQYAAQWNVIVLLKGTGTIVANHNGKSVINRTGNPGMATAGSGDVLSGMIGAFLAQGMPAFESAKWAARIHGRAGDLAAKQRGRIAMIASDIIENIPKVLKKSK